MLRFVRPVFVLVFAFMCACALCACAFPQAQLASNSQNDEVAENRQYMSALNQMATDLSGRMVGFADAVSRNDTVSMQTQADEAFKLIEKMREQAAPSDLVDLKEGYLGACDKLEEALEGYIALYGEVSGQAPTPAAYAERLQHLQQIYNSAVDLLEETDTKATELQK